MLYYCLPLCVFGLSLHALPVGVNQYVFPSFPSTDKAVHTFNIIHARDESYLVAEKNILKRISETTAASIFQSPSSFA